jgi:SWI/SNF-related matrix-associated actin-dependent regulator 1 of chromatin subfamily A
MIPQHLQTPVVSGHSYGRVAYDAARSVYRITAEPRVLQVATRVLPGCKLFASSAGVRAGLSFKATARSMEDLNWLLLRFPMEIEAPESYNADLERSRKLAARRAAGFSLPAVATSALFRGTLRPYQAEGVAFLLHNRRTLLADDIGLGKTVMAMGALAAANAWPAVVVAPTPVMRQWVDHANQFLQVEGFNLLNEQACILQGTKPYAPEPFPVYVIHYGLLQYWAHTLIEMGVQVVVFDEIQDLRHATTNKYSRASALSIAAEYAWGLSGTPIHNYGGEIHSVLNIVENLCLEEYTSFSREWCDAYDSKKVLEPKVLGDHLRREGLMLRRVRDEVSLQLPPLRRAVVRIDHDADTYREGVAGVMALARGYDEIKEFTEKGKAKRKILQASRKAAGVAKAPYAAAFIEGLLAAGEKVIVFSWHHAVHDYLFERLSKHYRGVQLTGRQSPGEKHAAQMAFAEGRADFIELSHRTSAGLNGLQKHGTCVVFPELDWSPAVHAQCEGRLHRDGVQGDSVLCYYLVASTGYDDTMQEALGLKVQQFSGLMGIEGESAKEKALGEEDVKRHLDNVVSRLTAELAEGRF